jgi:hypothetical protein
VITFPAEDRGREEPGHERGELETRSRRARPLRDLQVERQEGDRAEQREADDEANGARGRERPVPEERKRQDRFRRTPLDEHERRQQDDARDDQPDDLRRTPGPGRPAEAREEDDRRQVGRKQRGAEVVHRVPAKLRRGAERDRDHGEREEADRDVDVEDPAPAQVVDEEAAEQRPDDRRDAEDGSEVALVAPTLARRDDVADDGQRDDDQPARAEPLQGAEGDQLTHALREPAQRGSDEENRDRSLKDDLAAVEVADDRRQRRRDDRLVERREQQDQQQRAEDQAHPPA